MPPASQIGASSLLGHFLNFYIMEVGQKWKFKFNKLEDYHQNTYENPIFYKEQVKRFHDSHLRRDKQFQVGKQVLLFNLRLRLFPKKLKSRWSRPYTVTQIFPHSAVEILHLTKGILRANNNRLKPYVVMDGSF